MVSEVQALVKRLIPWEELTGKEKVVLVACLLLIGIQLFVSILNLTPYDPTKVNLDERFSPPSIAHIFGTDHLGRDVFSRVLAGFKISIYVAALSVLITAAFSVPLGMISGYVGGFLDRFLTFVMDSFYTLPRLVLALLIAFLLGRALHLNALAIAVATIPSFFRVARSVTLSVKERTFIEAARASGVSTKRILLKHISYHVRIPIVVLSALTIGDSIYLLASLGFLGLGVEPPTPEWGTDLATAREFITRGAWWAAFFPGVAIIINTFLFLMLGETLNIILNPLTREKPY